MASCRGNGIDNDEALKCFCRALELLVTTIPRGALGLVATSNAFMNRFVAEGKQEDLDNGVSYAKQAVASCNHQDEDFLACLEHMSEVVTGWSDRPRSPETSLVNLNFAIEVHLQALEFFSSASFNSKDARLEARILISLGNLRKFSHDILRRGRDDIDMAVDYFSRALKLPMTMITRIRCLIYASDSLIMRFEEHGRQDVEDLEDLRRAEAYANDAVTCSNSVSVCPADSLNLLGKVKRCKFEATRDMRDSDAAISAARRALEAAEQETGPSNVALHDLLINLASHLKLRSMKTNKSEEMIEATEFTQRAVDLWPPDHPRRIETLMILSMDESFLGHKLQDTKYTERGFQHSNEARSLYAKQGRLDHALGFDLDLVHVGRLIETKKWKEAVTVLRSLSGYPHKHSHPRASLYYGALCNCYSYLWTRTQKREHIDMAIGAAILRVNSCKSKTQEGIGARAGLGECLYSRFRSTNYKKDLDHALEVLQEGFQTSGGLPFVRITLGQMAIEMLCEQADCDWKLAQRLSKDVVDLYTILTGRSAQWSDKQDFLRICSYQVSTYAAIALQAGSSLFDVIDMLETCRGSIFGQVIENRTDLDDLKEVNPEAAKRFSALRDELNASIDPAGNLNMRVDETLRRSQAEEEIGACLEEIRKLEGFHRFLRGPSRGDLEAAAVEGPIIIVNVTSIRSDAIIVTKDTTVSLDLPNLKLSREEARDKVEEFRQAVQINFLDIKEVGVENKKYRILLKWLWNNCVKLIFKKLDELIPGTTKFRVWWMGIGIASSLPFHAAGIYFRNGKLRETALDRAISSYTPTLKVLLHGRREMKIDQLKRDVQRTPIKPKLLIVTMPSTPGISISDLKGVTEESRKLQDIDGVKNSYSVQTICQPSARDTKELMEKFEIVHFACHGQVIPTDPSSSHLLLQTTDPHSKVPRIDKLTVKDVASLNLSHGKLAFLSACSTADNPHSGLSDEGLHLASAFHVAGYSHTVGNLWPADDEVSPEIAAQFYQHLVDAGELNDGQNVAQALNKTLIHFSKHSGLGPLSWAPYVHFGV